MFSYSARKTAIRDVSLKIPRGKMTALVGFPGCGKSTIASLFNALFRPRIRQHLHDGQDCTSIKPEDLRKKIIMVPQYVSLFSGTIAENLRIAAPNATDEELLQALSDVRLKDWVTAQPGGLKHARRRRRQPPLRRSAPEDRHRARPALPRRIHHF